MTTDNSLPDVWIGEGKELRARRKLAMDEVDRLSHGGYAPSADANEREHIATLDYRRWAKNNADRMLDYAEAAEATIKSLRDALERFAVSFEYQYAESYIATCGLCAGRWAERAEDQHAPDCLLAKDAP